MTDFVGPQFSDIDAWGLTHPGKLRSENQDHFFLGSLARGIYVDHTSIGTEGRSVLHTQRMASLAMVADGVGGRAGGEEAARLAVRDLISKVSEFYHDAEHEEERDPEIFSRLLHDAALACHESLVKKGAAAGGGRKFSTTLTLFLGLWPHAYLLQLGDSRCYIYQNGSLTQMSQDQTLAQELVDAGTLTQTMGHRSKWANVLSSAMGGETAAPVVTRMTRDWGSVVLICSDGLTKHVSDERIAHILSTMRNAKEAAEQLLQEALADGGTDNITMIVGRTVKPAGLDD
jgi:PPM family protein phosphatase